MHCTGRFASDRSGNISIRDCIRTSIFLGLIGKLKLDINIELGNLLCYDNMNILGQTRKQTTQEYEYLHGFAQTQRKNILHVREMARIHYESYKEPAISWTLGGGYNIKKLWPKRMKP